MKFRRGADADFKVTEGFGVGHFPRGGNEVVAAFRVVPAKDLEAGAVVGARIPLALDGVHLVAAAGDDEVDFPAGFVAPVAGGRVGQMGLEILQHEVFPQGAQVVVTKGVPAAGEADKASVEAIDLGHLGQFVLAPAVERADHRDGVGDFEGAQMALDGRTGNADGGGGLGHLKLAAALAQEVLEELVEAVHVAETEEPLDVAGKKGVDPFAIEGGFLGLGQQGRRQAAMQETPGEREVSERGQLVPRDRHEVDRAFAAREGVAELLAGSQGRGPGGEDFELGKDVGADFQEPAGITELVDFVKNDDLFRA